MADGLEPGSGRESVPDEHSSGGDRDEHTGLPVLPSDAQGGHGNPDLRDQASDVGERPPVRNDDGGKRSERVAKYRRELAATRNGGGLRAGDDSNSGNGLGGEENGDEAAGETDSTELSDVENGHRRPPRKTTARDTEARIRNGSEVLDFSVELDLLTNKAIKKANEILNMRLRKHDKEFTAILRAQVAQIQAVFTTQVRVDEGRFKRRQVDTLEKLLERLSEEEKKLPVIDQT